MATPTQYDINSFIKGVNGFGLPFCSQIYSATLAAATNTTLTVPSMSAIGTLNSTTLPLYVAIFTYAPSAKVYVANNATAVVPAGAAFAVASSSLNPTARVVKGGDVINFICTAGADVTVEFYSIQVG